MSLGLDALNKLQRMRAEDAGARATTAFSTAHHPKPGVNRLLVAGTIISLAVAVFALYRSRAGAPAASAVTPAPARPLVAAQPVPTPSAPVVDVIPEAHPAPSSANAVSTSTPPSYIAAPAPQPVEHHVRPVGPNPLVASFIARARIGGVDDGRSGQRPLILFNDAICHVNDTVNLALGVRLVGIQSHRLTFQDTRGILYVRNLFPL